MAEASPTRGQQIARAVSVFERQRTGLPPESVTVLLGGETLVVTLHGVLAPAERALARSAQGEALLAEFHRALFASASTPLRQEIGRITGAQVREAAAEVQGATGTVVLIFLLADSVPAETWGPAAPPD
jgi:uncharacterized protein YbcI